MTSDQVRAGEGGCGAGTWRAWPRQPGCVRPSGSPPMLSIISVAKRLSRRHYHLNLIILTAAADPLLNVAECWSGGRAIVTSGSTAIARVSRLPECRSVVGSWWYHPERRVVRWSRRGARVRSSPYEVTGR